MEIILGEVAKGIDPAAERKKAVAAAKAEAVQKYLTLDGLLIGLVGLAFRTQASEAIRREPSGRCAVFLRAFSTVPRRISTGQPRSRGSTSLHVKDT